MTINIEMAELEQLTSAINKLADALTGCKTPCKSVDAADNVLPFPGGETQQNEASATTGATEAVTPAEQSPEVLKAAPAPAPAPVKHEYTLAEISVAGAVLVDAGRMDELLKLLASYNVQAVTQLKSEQYDSFAHDLEKLGAKL